ncbi:MAG: hypothetical protein MZV70_67300 [Desulfobacterales bacterium]|nr:hypothetical protein [Desulfobacterales bacterium]
MLTKAFIPYKGYFSSPFARWQGSMANEHAIILAAESTKRWLAEKRIDPKSLRLRVSGAHRSPAPGVLRRPLGGRLDGRGRGAGPVGQPGLLDLHRGHLLRGHGRRDRAFQRAASA